MYQNQFRFFFHPQPAKGYKTRSHVSLYTFRKLQKINYSLHSSKFTITLKRSSQTSTLHPSSQSVQEKKKRRKGQKRYIPNYRAT
ncbi:hypothetical protein AAHA92_29134 [Salvia divinorum]|uniref:Uncharacterized protein n=1 Tax=Salvia divinorum TaxID=28513 RepID=A0ABD1FXC9_SALDI